ncbi:tautomerase family protein [Halomonas sp. HK25]|uniref:tautomerase family protein n=1 Tax=Halomonas sp. HK25 TaxID=3394321 RepID=UPI0039FD8784
MPIINVKIKRGSAVKNDTETLTKEIAKRLTESTVRVLKKNRELVVVTIDSQSSTKWHLAGEEGIQSSRPMFEVEIKVTEGSNSQEEVSTWIREAYETMVQVLGESAGPNYISVQQQPQEFWGYDGLSQYGRKKWDS